MAEILDQTVLMSYFSHRQYPVATDIVIHWLEVGLIFKHTTALLDDANRCDVLGIACHQNALDVHISCHLYSRFQQARAVTLTPLGRTDTVANMPAELAERIRQLMPQIENPKNESLMNEKPRRPENPAVG